jgi:H+/Cl- antiporter ClcA
MSLPHSKPRQDHTLILLLFAVFVLVSPIKAIWAGAAAPWYAPFLVWGGLIAMTFWRERRERRDV